MNSISTLNEAELEEEFVRSSGPGGQNVNKVATRVTLRHLPTGLTVSVQDTRSQARNRELARIRLLELLNERHREARNRAQSARELERRRKRPRPHKVKVRILQTKKRRGALKKERNVRNFE